MKLPPLSYETRYISQKMRVCTGIDEVGRGSLAGPLVIAAVSYTFPCLLDPRIQDSKRLTSITRAVTAKRIRQTAQHISVVSFAAKDIDMHGLSWCLYQGMNWCLKNTPIYDIVLIDGRPLKKPLDHGSSTLEYLVKGDSKAYTIAAASIIAKTYRDHLMQQTHAAYPRYGWNTNVGYGTKQHIAAIRQFGTTAHHRQSFITNHSV